MTAAGRRARLLRAGLGVEGPADPTVDDWADWVRLATDERVLPQLHAVAARSGLLTAEQREEATAIQVDVAATSVRLERSLLEVATVLDDAGVPFAVLKGGATAHLDHDDPAHRQFGDLDLLVAPDAFARARAAVERAGWRQAYRLPRHHEEFTHSVTFRRGGLAELDLHQRIAHRALGRVIPTDELLARRVPLTIAGHELCALDRSDRLVHAAIHAVASRGPYRRLSSRLDVLVLARRAEEDAAEVVERAARWGVHRIVTAAMVAAFDEARMPVPDGWSAVIGQHTDSPPRGSLVERAYTGDRRHPILEEVAHLRSLPGTSRRMRYLRGYFLMERGREGPAGRVSLGKRARYLASRLRGRD